MIPNTVVSGYMGSSPAAYKMANEWQVINELPWAQLEKATRKMKKWADKHKRDVVFQPVGRAAYRVELSVRLKIHPVFHVSNLKPYHADLEEPSRGESQRAPPLMVTSFDKEVECIMAKREVRRKGVPRIYCGDEDVTGLGGGKCHGPHVQGPGNWIDHARPLSPHVQIRCTVVGKLRLVTVVGRCR
ncbi:unnamed protein product [Prunus armeniaca]